jgi:hypothetical protein
MRAHGRKNEIRKRFAIVIGVAAVGVIALGAQTGAQVPDVVSYGTKVTIDKDWATLHGEVNSKGGRKCWVGREVIVFRKRPGPDRELGATRSVFRRLHGRHNWEVLVKGLEKQGPGRPDLGRVFAKVTREVGDGFVCRADKSRVLVG